MEGGEQRAAQLAHRALVLGDVLREALLLPRALLALRHRQLLTQPRLLGLV